ncbi:iron siderophore ABC transporter, periplasmic substrate-binding protein [Malaciobacter marinus]|uniref:Iron ABC transporter substrate-binding protein n=1 Tax=Malaciobacter marinus TaxID=505249 RepID=A0A347TKU7_9BACT|nr:helical backbone metal receptor [Malaciobacter marinus]AXX87225.1 iron siderophore ABC transporter, periplasmic substrate-binding protein [Malaciobacter marinus]PHO14886.1 iron ABC transporter substrate-binding protein [Malaciobacter marinus]
MRFFILLVCVISISLANQRIVTLSPSINEIVYALNKGEEVVANTAYCNYPKESKKVKKVGGYANISLEKILKVKPTLVLTQNYNQKLINNLKALGIKTLVFKTDTIESIKHTIKTLGKEFDKQKKANELIYSIDKSLKSIENIITNQKIMIVIHPSKNLKKSIFIAGNNLYFNDILKASGNKNAYISKNQAQPVLNVEKIIALNPDIVIILAAFFENDKKALDEVINVWKKLPIKASIKDNIYAIDKEYAGIPSHRVKYFIKDYKKILVDVKNK